MSGPNKAQPAVPDPKWDDSLVSRSSINGGFGLKEILAKGVDSSGH